MLIERCGLEALLHSGTDSKRNYMSAAVRGVRVEAFVKDKDQDAILLESGIVEQRSDIVLEPCICGGQLYVIGATSGRRGAVMRVVVLVGHHKRIIRQLIVGQVGAEVSEGNQIQPLHTAICDIREVRQG